MTYTPPDPTSSLSDLDSGSRGLLLLRQVRNGVGLAVTLQDDGDIEVFLDASTLRLLVDALRGALRAIVPSDRDGEVGGDQLPLPRFLTQ